METIRIVAEGQGELIQPPDLEAFREWNRLNKPRVLVDKVMSEREAVERFVHDGDYVATELYGTVRCPMSLTREVVRQKKKSVARGRAGGVRTRPLVRGGPHQKD